MSCRLLMLVILAFVLASLGSARLLDLPRDNRTHTAVCDASCKDDTFTHLGMNKVMARKEADFARCRAKGICPTNLPAVSAASGGVQQCTNGQADGQYDCEKIDMLAYISGADLGSSADTSDIWGATLEISGQTKHVAIVCHGDGTSFVDITSTANPLILGFLPTYDCGEHSVRQCTFSKIWRDVKVYNNKAYIVSENKGHGMQVFDLTTLYTDPVSSGWIVPGAAGGPQQLTETDHFGVFGSSHNIVLNEESGFAYVVGSTVCKGGLYVVDVKGDSPVEAGCFSADNYTHDAQCVTYDNRYPDDKYWGKEICFAYNEDTVTIVDVTDKDNMFAIARVDYNGAEYTHQGWMTPDGKYILVNDELDEVEETTFSDPQDQNDHGQHTRTMVWDVTNLEEPEWKTSFMSTKNAIDHNLYTVGKVTYETNYCAGLRVLNSTTPEAMNEVAYFDVSPDCDAAEFMGAWSNYPYFDHEEDRDGLFRRTQTVVVSSIERGFYLLRVHLPWGLQLPIG